MKLKKKISPVYHITRIGFLLISFFTFLSLTTNYDILKYSHEQMLGHGHNLPPSIVGDREIFLNFTKPQIESTAENGIINFVLVDKKTGNNIPHVTYIVGIYNHENKNMFTANLHGHNGEIKLEFHHKGLEDYNINANYDSLSASYVSDFGSPIKIDGSVFSDPGKYRVVTEITGIDFDNTFLPEPLKYEYTINVR